MNYSLSLLYQRIKKPELSKEQAESKVCQEVFISKLGNDSRLSSRVAFKGGIIIDSLSKGQRGFTKDIDIDFIKYPLSNDGIFEFIKEISEKDPYRNISITVSNIEQLRHKNYFGKRVILSFTDSKSTFFLTVDIGVHTPLLKSNKIIDYEIAFGGNTKLTINPIERMLFDKLSTFAIYGTDNTRDKDFFDAYFLISSFKTNSKIVSQMINKNLVITNHYYKSHDLAVCSIIETISDGSYQQFLKNSKRNWLHLDISIMIEVVLIYLKSLLK